MSRKKIIPFQEARPRDLPPTVIRSLLAAAFLKSEYGIEPYAKARNLAMAAEQEYNEVLETYDAITVPCGKPEGLPVGLMLVGNHFDETTLFTLAAAIEDTLEYV